MLHFIYGPAASGKTYTVLARIREDIRRGKNAVLLVPEQFSFETERAVLHTLGDRDASSVKVISFTRLCDEVDRLTGGICGMVLGDSDKLVLMQRALISAAGSMRRWDRYARQSGFAATVLKSVEELKLNAVTPDGLLQASESAESPSLTDKLYDLSVIFSQFEALVGERFIDPSDRLTRLADKLISCRYFAGKTVYIDSFKGFTGQQYRVIDRIIAQSDDVTVSMTNASSGDSVGMQGRSYDIFENIRAAGRRLTERANAHYVPVEPPIYLTEMHYRGRDIAAVECLLSTGNAEPCVSDGSVTVCRAVTPYDEAEFTARTIRRLVREEGYRYRDFVIIVRDAAPYEEAVAAACAKNGVSCFIDRRLPLSSFPPAVAVLAAIDVIRSFSSEQILRFHKSGLGVLSVEETAELENYVYLWNINGGGWKREWDMNPRGLIAEEFSPQDAETLLRLNRLRDRAIAPLLHFAKAFKGSVRSLSAAIVALLEECGANRKFMALYREYNAAGRQDYADALRQSWDILMRLLDSLVNCFGRGENTTEAFCDALKTALALTTIGVAPQMLDEVTFGTADRIRPSRPRVAFVLGANQGVFPRSPSSGGLFGFAEREQMIQLGIDISDRGVSESIDEDFLVYTNICCATDRLYLCYSALDHENQDREPAAFVGQILAKLSIDPVCEPDHLNPSNLPETSGAAFSDYCIRLSGAPAEAETVLAGLNTDGQYDARFARIRSAGFERSQHLTPQTAEALYGRSITMSATRLDEFHRCKFGYFCKNGMNIKPLQPADFDVLQRGTLVHYVLQQLIEEYGGGIAARNETDISRAVDRYIARYLDSIPGYRSVETPRLRFLIDNMARSLKAVARHLAEEFAQSEFEPVCCELKFGKDGGAPLTVPFDGGELRLTGSVDRVDRWNGYVRVVDYKTGSRKFHLPDVLFGQNIQMLLYLYAITRDGEFSGDTPAGIFYMPAKRDRSENRLAMNGLMVADETLVHAMERDNAGEYIPKYVLKNDGTLNGKYSAPFVPEDGFGQIFRHIERLLEKTGKSLLAGDISIDPRDGRDVPACKYCNFSAVCGIGDRACEKVPDLKNDQVLEELAKEENNGDSADR